MNTDKIIAESSAKDYAPKESSKLVALKKLDNKAKLPATIFTYAFGIVSALVFGTGMCLGMQVIGDSLATMILGIIIGIIGLIGCGMNYPIYKRMLDILGRAGGISLTSYKENGLSFTYAGSYVDPQLVALITPKASVPR